MKDNAVERFIAIDSDARDFGFEWPNVEMIFEQILSELEEVKEALKNAESKERIQEEVGDLIATTMSLCVFAGFDPEETLAKQNKKFSARMKMLKQLTKQQGLESLKDQALETSLKFWHEVKKFEKKVNEIT